MTRKDFILIAETIRSSLDTFASPGHARIFAMVMATELTTTNPNFDRNRFLKACGVDHA